MRGVSSRKSRSTCHGGRQPRASLTFVNENVSAVGVGRPIRMWWIEPGACGPVTLGGPGQGGVNTKPTFDPSPLMRLPGSTRRSCAVQARVVEDSRSVTVRMSVAHLTTALPTSNHGVRFVSLKRDAFTLKTVRVQNTTKRTERAFSFHKQPAVWQFKHANTWMPLELHTTVSTNGATLQA